ncbi:DUF1853 family protein [Arcobacter sp. LA11]|uniref:DUF1853 family protein n=1 Tax=Arcobacter sp. LA11 TaxID=1898176 RepID=UPI000932148A|nr:DUF1853 family protein [Arcobacter sp. LA11]
MNNKNLKEQFLGFYNTPSLFIDDIYGITNFEFDEIDISSLDFTKLVITEKVPLGKRIERFFEFYIINSNRYELILKNIQVIVEKNTIGEIDFVVFDKKNSEFLHVELVYKYYIYDKTFSSELNRYIGPNRNDTLIKKLTKLKNKQFPLLFKNETKKYLKDIDINNIKQRLCFKANLFYLQKDFNNKYELVNNLCKKGLYITYKEFITNGIYKSMKYYIPHRYDWVCSFNTIDSWANFEETKKIVKIYNKMRKSPLLWINNFSKIEWLFITFK